MKSEDQFKELLSQDVQDYIDAHLNTSIPELILKGIPFDLEPNIIVNQINGKKKAKKKLPTWYNTPNIIYPPNLSLEQTSSEITAHHKSKFITGSSMIDLTGGFGVDDYYFSKQLKTLYYIENNKALFDIATHNFRRLERKNIEVVFQDSIEFLTHFNFKLDWIYTDPSRRNEDEKVFLLKDSLPNVLDCQNLLKEKSKYLMIKTSPMYDIDVGFEELKGVKELHIISVKNEVKELLWIIDWSEKNTRDIKLYNYQSKKRFSYHKISHQQAREATIELSRSQNYLYEFNSSIMKSGFFDAFGSKYGLKKLDVNTHIYTSNLLIKSFPGKVYAKIDEQPINFKKLKSEYKGKSINLIAKNIQLSTRLIQQKLNCKIGGKMDYLMFTKTIDGNKVIKSRRIV